jgi:FimV-like protein
MTLQPGDRLGPLEVVSSLGSGGMGEVYQARDTRLGRDVAIKVLPEALSGNAERLARLEQEARSLASLSHPNVAVVYGLEEHKGTRCLVMELVPGVTLAERLARGPLRGREALDVARQLAEALEGAHAAGVIHRDLKPSNVKITPEGRVKLLDFGLAKAAQGDASDSRLSTGSPMTREGVVLGTAAYMSPEQARGQLLDKRTDVWSFGCVLYEMLAGRRPFEADTRSDTLVALLEREPDWNALPPITPASVRSLIQRCLQKDRSRRLHDVADARIELEDAIAATSASAPIAAGTNPRSASRSRLALAVVAALAVVIAAVALLRTRAAPSPDAAGVRTTLAVLPFHVGSETQQDEVGLGLADDIITHLANTPALRVRPTQAVLRYQGQLPDVQEAGRALKADHLLTGAIRRHAGGYRVTAQLVRVEDGSPFWGASYDLAASELPGLEDRITAEVTQALGLRQSEQAKARNERRHTTSHEAYEAYLRGRAAMAHGDEKGTVAAVAAFEEAQRLDPSYALAHAGLSVASARMHLRFASAGDRAGWRERALREAERASALGGELAETHQALAGVYGETEFEWDRVFKESDRALELDPGLDLPHSYMSRAFYHLGLLQRAERRARVALSLDPASRSAAVRALAITHLLAGRAREAIPLLEEVQRLSGRPLSDYYLALACYYGGDKERAEAILEELAKESSPTSSQRARALLAAFLAARGERKRAGELASQVAAGPFMDHHVANSLGAAYAQLGRPADALRWLRTSADSGFPCRPWFASDPLLAPLRETAEFKAWLDELLRREQEADRLYAAMDR